MKITRSKLKRLIESFLDGNLPGKGKSYRDQPKKYRITKENPHANHNKSYYDDMRKWDTSSVPQLDNRTIKEKIQELIVGLIMFTEGATSKAYDEEGKLKPINFYISTYGGAADDMFALKGI